MAAEPIQSDAVPERRFRRARARLGEAVGGFLHAIFGEQHGAPFQPCIDQPRIDRRGGAKVRLGSLQISPMDADLSEPEQSFRISRIASEHLLDLFFRRFCSAQVEKDRGPMPS